MRAGGYCLGTGAGGFCSITGGSNWPKGSKVSCSGGLVAGIQAAI